MKIRLGAFVVAAAALSATIADVDAQQVRAPNYSRDCVAELRRGDPFANAPESRLPDIATRCRDISLNNATGGVRAHVRGSMRGAPFA